MLSGAGGKGKIIKLNKFNDNTFIPLEPTDTPMDTECAFDCVLINPLGHSEILSNSSYNNFTIEMKLKLAQSLGIDGAFILPVRQIQLQEQIKSVSQRNAWCTNVELVC